MNKTEPLTKHEENILRATIDEAAGQMVDVPPKTVKKLLALVDALRETLAITEPLRKAWKKIDDAFVATVDPFNPNRIGFICDAANRETFGLLTVIDGVEDARVVTRGECVAYFRETLGTVMFQLPNTTFHAGAELADLIERGDLP